MEKITQLEAEITKINERNHKVEIDKAWEVSFTRRISIMILTYIVASIWLWAIDESYVFLKAVVPVLGYLLSTLSIPQVKRVWAKQIRG